MVRKFRLISQVFFLILFLVLLILTSYRGSDEIRYPVRIFLEFDPLVGLITLLASHQIPLFLLLGLITLGFTFLFGRVFCGWVCPLGTINHAVGWLAPHSRDRFSIPRFLNYRLKYYILTFFLGASVLSLQWVGILDPISLLIRSMTLTVEPIFNRLVHGLFALLYFSNIDLITLWSEPLYDFLKRSILSFRQPHFHQGIMVGLLFALILLLNLIQRRFWCTVLCPLGALLGVIARFSRFERLIDDSCNECGQCFTNCFHGQKEGLPRAWVKSECLVCGNCQDVCPERAVQFKTATRSSFISRGPDLVRRNLIVSAFSGVVAVPLMRIRPGEGLPHPRLIRPPGALSEKEFLQRCIKCGECMKVCLTNGLQPTLFEAGIEGIWSPILVSRVGYCQYYCTLCGQVCPSGAIRRLSQAEKVKTKIGLAFIDMNRCLPYAQGIPCIVCEEYCPTAKKAIWFEEALAIGRDGKKRSVKKPKVDIDLCIGCGICEFKCPVVDQPAIYVTSIGESRSEQNRLTL
ncbi:MAG: 4Fe-4S binding protein [Syntrophobacterales bacterium]|nr:MAG: 4Fe-4S binding protein [Syntrophobacterales bacterium]